MSCPSDEAKFLNMYLHRGYGMLREKFSAKWWYGRLPNHAVARALKLHDSNGVGLKESVRDIHTDLSST